MIIRGFPRSSRTHAIGLADIDVRVPPPERDLNAPVDVDRWGPLEYLVADLIDQVHAASISAAYYGSEKKPPRLQPTPRPTDNLKAQRELHAARERAQREFTARASEAIRSGQLRDIPSEE